MAITIETWINELMASRGYSLADLTAVLVYSSKTSVVRVMKNQVNQRAVEAFAQRIERYLDLTPEERARFTEAMELLRWQKDYAASREILRFLRGQDEDTGDVWLEEIDTGRRMQLFPRYERMHSMKITLLNSQYVSVFGALNRLVTQRGAKIVHYLQMTEDSARVIHAIHKLVPLIFERFYAGFCYRYGDLGESGGVRGMCNSDAMVVEYITENGTLREDMIVFSGENRGTVRTIDGHNGFVRMLGIQPENYAPLKTLYFQGEAWDSYVYYSKEYARLECNRAMYAIKPDPGLEFVPADILVKALREGGSLPDDPRLPELVNEFEKIHAERVRNIFEKRHMTKMVMKRSAMVRFARTGRLQDHFWGMRNFTPEERVRVLQLLVEQMEKNPYFNIYFLNDNDFLQDTAIAYYEGEGIAMMPANTDYALAGNHSEVMLVHSEFMRMFKEYYERELLRNHVMSRADTLNLMSDLIRLADSEEEA